MSRTFCAAIALALLGACAPGGTGPGGDGSGVEDHPATMPPEVEITVAEQGVTNLPQDVAAGIVTITFTNEGAKPLFPAFARINEGVKPEKVGVAISTGDFETFFASAVPAGSALTPGEKNLLPDTSGSITTELTEGTYIVVDPEAKDFEPGYLEVGPGNGDEVDPPAAHYALDVGEYFIEVDAALPAGEHLIQVTNTGEQGHELILFEKKTEKEAGFTFAPPPGQTSWVTFELEPGRYQFACFFPDVKNGKVGKKNHAQLGMKANVTVE